MSNVQPLRFAREPDVASPRPDLRFAVRLLVEDWRTTAKTLSGLTFVFSGPFTPVTRLSIAFSRR